MLQPTAQPFNYLTTNDLCDVADSDARSFIIAQDIPQNGRLPSSQSVVLLYIYIYNIWQNWLFVGKNAPFVEKILNQTIAVLPLQRLIEGVFDRQP